MARAKILHCRCGKLKTVDNTDTIYTVKGKEYFHYLCKECDSAQRKNKRLDNKSKEQLVIDYQATIKRAEYIQNFINQKYGS